MVEMIVVAELQNQVQSDKDLSLSFDEVVDQVIDINSDPDRQFDSDGQIISVDDATVIVEDNDETEIEIGEPESPTDDTTIPDTIEVVDPDDTTPLIEDDNTSVPSEEVTE